MVLAKARGGLALAFALTLTLALALASLATDIATSPAGTRTSNGSMRTRVNVPACTAFCKYYLICTCGDPVTGVLPPPGPCAVCVRDHAANFSSPLARSIPCSVERALTLCGAHPGPPPPSPPPSPPPPPPPGATTDVYVSAAHGSDSNSGASPTAALATITRGLAAARKLRGAARLLLDGTFVVTNATLNINVAGVQLDGWPGKPRPRISGAAVIPAAAWTKSARGPGLWQAPVPASVSRALDGGAAIYVGGVRRTVVRTPTLHWNTSLGPRHSPLNTRGFHYTAGDIPASWSLAPASLARWRVAAFHSWNKAYHRVASVSRASRTIKFAGPAQFGYGDYTYCSLKRYYYENVPEMTPEAGSGDWQASETTLYYAPRPHEDMTSAEVKVPVLPVLLTIYSAGVGLSNMIVEHSAGVPDCGASAADRAACDSDLAEMAGGAVTVGGGAQGVRLTNVTFREVGGYGLKANNAPGIAVERSAFLGCGAGGALINGSPLASVRNSYVVGFGRRYPGGVGVVLGNSPNGTVAHCDVSGGLYNGLVYGGVNDAGAFSTFELNHVHGNGVETDDGICDFGAIHGQRISQLPRRLCARKWGGGGFMCCVLCVVLCCVLCVVCVCVCGQTQRTEGPRPMVHGSGFMGRGRGQRPPNQERAT